MILRIKQIRTSSSLQVKLLEAYRLNCFKKQAKNLYVARLNIRGVLLMVRNKSNQKQQRYKLNPILVKMCDRFCVIKKSIVSTQTAKRNKL